MLPDLGIIAPISAYDSTMKSTNTRPKIHEIRDAGPTAAAE